VLNCLQTRGATVGLKTGKWTRAQKLDALERGSHQSACQHLDFLCEEFVYMIQKGHWVLLPAHMVLDEMNLRLGTLGVVPQRDRRPRTIYDYNLLSVNLDTIPLAPSESMQFGKALWRILQQVSTADPRLGPVHLSKIDIADGFYRMWINLNDVPKLGVMFPGAPGDDPLVGFPLVLPMGWMQSPPLFTAATETVADLANQKLQANGPSTRHRLDLLSEASPLPEREGPPQYTGTAELRGTGEQRGAVEKQQAIEEPPPGWRLGQDTKMIWKERRSASAGARTSDSSPQRPESEQMKNGTRHSNKFVESTTIDANRGSNKQKN
jgi:hypothetical protein